ncbi:MAG: T9SS type A sorting domain-containing protein [candidate division WOR-3 bacterium]|nr:MAG: T9SS type A sorting domain-containing protein [candidate division WOR-3 bacterium]
MRRTLLFSFVPLLAIAGTVTKTFTFDSQDLRFGKANGYDVVEMADFISTLEPGEPMMPAAVFNVLVPPTATVTDVQATPLDPEVIPGHWLIHPAQHPVPISAAETPEFVDPDPGLYSGSASYPIEIVDWNRTGTKSEFRICGFAIRPLSYRPSTGELTLYRTVEVTVRFQENDRVPVTLTPSQVELFSEDVRQLVANPEDLKRFSPPSAALDDPEVHYVIITHSSLESGFAALADWRTRKGWITEIRNTDWIYANYTGRDLQERMRNFVVDYYENRGLKYVLLAGDHGYVPGRRCHARVNNSTGYIPADVYYADLQWSYDGNNNNIFGEMGYDTVDLFYDVYVGRASVDNSSQVSTFVSKVMTYERNPTTDYLKKICLPYVWLWSGYSGKVCNDSIAALTPADWTDYYIPDPTSTTPMRNAIDAGYHFVHPTAHGSATGLYDMYGRAIYTTSTAGSQTNSTRPCIANSIACISGNFEYSDCLAEALMNNPGGGAVAVMMNSREGWGTPPSLGPSEKMDIKFYDFFFRFDTLNIGLTHARAKDYYAYAAQGQGVWRWCYWDLNLFGDPDMPMWKDTPGTMLTNRPDTVETGARTLDIHVTSGGSAVSRALVCCYKDGEVHESGFTNWNGDVSLAINPLTTGPMLFTVTGKSKYPLEDTIQVVQGTPQPYLAYEKHVIEDGNNGELEAGETADLFVTLDNLGSAQATNVRAILRTASNHITMADSTSDYGNIGPADTSTGDRFRLTASSQTPPGTRIRFTVHVIADQGSWDPTFDVTVGQTPMPGMVFMDHDTGYCKLTVTALGGIGFTEPPADAKPAAPALDLGAGFSYPKAVPSQLYYASLMVGNSASWLVDRFYGQPANSGPNTDFAIVESLRPRIPPSSGDEHFRSVMNDAGHPSPKNLLVTQHSHQNTDTGYDDFVVLAYDLKNHGSSSIDNIYAGVIADFDIGPSATDNIAASNEAKRYSYMRQPSTQNPCVGIKVLDPPSFANLTAVDHARYVYPTDSCMSDNQKYRILNGGISARNSDRPYDWSVATSVGPVSLPAGGTQRVAFAILGGSSEAAFDASADSAQSWYDDNSAVFEETGVKLLQPADVVTCVPNPFSNSVRVSCQVRVAGQVTVRVFDISGRAVATLVDRPVPAGRVDAVWNPKALANGVYLLKVTLPDQTLTEKLLLMQ